MKNRIICLLLTPIIVCMMAGTGRTAHTHLVAHWKFDEVSGGVAADSAFGNDAVWQNGTDTNLTWVPGVINGAADLEDFPFAANYFDAGVIPQITGPQISISVWVNRDAADATYEGIFTSRSNGSKALAFEVDHIDFHTPGSSNQLDSAGGLVDDTWYHVLAVYDNIAEEREIYINGALSSSNTFVGGVDLDGADTWQIGFDDCCFNRHFDGLIDDLAVFDTRLSANDAAIIYFLGYNFGIDAPTALIPEPASLALSVLGFLSLVRVRRR